MNEKQNVLVKLEENVKRFLNGEMTLYDCLHEHMIICFNYIPSSLVEVFGKDDIHAATLNMFQSVLYLVERNDLAVFSHPPINVKIDNNEDGLKLLMKNVEEYLNGDKNLNQCLNTHMEICSQLDDYIEYFNDGWSKDTHLNILKHVLRAVLGDKKAEDRLIVDLGIEDCCLTIVQVQ